MGPYFLMRLQFGRRVEFLNFEICSVKKTQYLEKPPLSNWGHFSANPPPYTNSQFGKQRSLKTPILLSVKIFRTGDPQPSGGLV